MHKLRAKPAHVESKSTRSHHVYCRLNIPLGEASQYFLTSPRAFIVGIPGSENFARIAENPRHDIAKDAASEVFRAAKRIPFYTPVYLLS